MRPSNATPMIKPDDAGRSWYVVDATDATVGRIASRIASVLRGKNKPAYTPHWDMGDFVIVVNAEKIHFSGRKWKQKKYYRHSGYTGSLKETRADEMREKNPERIIEYAVKGMLPKNKLGRQMFKKLKVYAGPEHPHGAQQPQELKLEN